MGFSWRENAPIVMDKPGAGNGRMSIAAEKCFPSGRPTHWTRMTSDSAP